MVSPLWPFWPGRLPGHHDVDAVILQDALQLATSASRGTLSRVSVSGVSSDTIISGSAAFLAPEIGMVPFRRLPPRMRMRSMKWDSPCKPGS